LDTFRKRGWQVIRHWRIEEGDIANTLETLALRWIRTDLNLPVYLDRQDMPRTEGHTETFEMGVNPTDLEVISWVETNLAELRARRIEKGFSKAPRAKRKKPS
jgi:hypothetical protein